MKTSDLGLVIVFLAATGLVITHAVANETYAAPNVVAGRENNAPDEAAPPLQQHRARSAPTQIAEGGSDKLLERRVAEGGSDKLLERRVAEGGSDKLLERRVAEGGSDKLLERRVAEGGSDRLLERRVAEGGSDKLLERRVAEGGAERLREREHRVADIGNSYSYGSAMNVNAHFSMD